MRKITADWVCPVSSEPLAEGVVITDDAGKILAVERRDQHDPATLEVYHGVLTPGLVNTHCHLELSHLRGKVNTGTGLIPFITGVVTQRGAEQEVIQEAIRQAEQEMLAGGIVAVGDISNAPDTFGVKARGALRYYTFVELFDFLQDANAQDTFEKATAVYNQLELARGSARAMVPHAPYSVSQSLFEKIRGFNGAEAGEVANQAFEVARDAALIGHDGFVELNKRFGNGRAALHRKYRIGAKAERFVKKTR